MNVNMVKLFDTNGDKQVTAGDINETFVDNFVGLKQGQVEAWGKLSQPVRKALLEKLIGRVANSERNVPQTGLVSMETVNQESTHALKALQNIPADKIKVDLLLAATKRKYNNQHIKNDFVDLLENIGTKKPGLRPPIQALFIDLLKGATLYPHSSATKMNNALAGWGVPNHEMIMGD